MNFWLFPPLEELAKLVILTIPVRFYFKILPTGFAPENFQKKNGS